MNPDKDWQNRRDPYIVVVQLLDPNGTVMASSTCQVGRDECGASGFVPTVSEVESAAKVAAWLATKDKLANV